MLCYDDCCGSRALRRAEKAGFVISAPPDVAYAYMVEGCGFTARGPSSQAGGCAAVALGGGGRA